MTLLACDESVFRAGERAFAALRARGIPPSPENYLVWYTHVSGENPALSRIIRLLEENRDPFGPERCRELYARFFLREEAQRTVAEATERIRAIADHLGRLVARSRDESERASANFQAIGDALGKTVDVAELRRLVAALDAEARQMSAQARAFGNELHRSSREVAALRAHLEKARREAETDGLTGVANRKRFEAAIREFASRSVEEGYPLAMIVLDIDHFKRFNDTYGHAIGDAVLRLVAGQIRALLREEDFLARYGGEEFVVLLPRRDLPSATAIAERLRAEVASRRVRSRDDGRDLGTVTISAGVGLYRPGEPLDCFFSRIDHALYVAKREGRNRVVREDQLEAVAEGSHGKLPAAGAA